MITKTAVATTVTTVSAARDRYSFVLQNQSDTDIYFSYDGNDPTLDSGASPGIKIAAGGHFACDIGSNRAAINGVIKAIHGGSGTKTLVCHEL